jgi:hypothetical protein
MKSQALITVSLVALLSAAASLVTTESALAGFGRMGGMGGSHMGGSHMGGMSRMGGGGFGRMSGMGGASRMSGLSHAGGMSRMGNVSSARGLGMAKHGGGSGLRGNSVKHTKVADRDVGGKMKEKAGTATHDAKGRPIGGSSTSSETGNTTSSYKNGNGTHDVKVADKDGKTLSTGTSGKEPNGGSTTYGGTSTTSTTNGNGTHTVTRTDSNGKSTTEVTNKPQASHIEVPDGKGGMKPYEPKKGPDSASSYNPDNGKTTTSTTDGNGKRTVTTEGPDRDVGGGGMKARAGTGSGEGERRFDGGERGGRGDGPVIGGDVAVPLLPFGPPNSGSTVVDGTAITVTGVGTDHKTVTTTKNGVTTVAVNVPAPPDKPATDLPAALKKLQDAAKAYADAKEKARSARASLTSIVNSDNLPDDVKANIPDAINQSQQADRDLKTATQNLQNAINDFNQQTAQLTRG